MSIYAHYDIIIKHERIIEHRFLVCQADFVTSEAKNIILRLIILEIGEQLVWTAIINDYSVILHKMTE
jgi:hypothetical protein